MRLFRRDENGFVLVMALLVMPIFIGFAFVIIDIGRGNNAHSDLATAADAVALAAAVELDGGVDAIPRAKAAMANLQTNVSMLARGGPDMEISLVYEDVDDNEFTVIFLEDIPEEDTTPITAEFLIANGTTISTDAKYVYVRAQSRNLDTAFFNPANLLPASVPVAAVAVAKSVSAICDIPPLYICNPFEFDSSGTYVGDELQTRFAAGDLHGRMVRLHPKGSGTHAPGNFGFLSVNGSSSASAIRSFFAGNRNPTCVATDTVTTKPGAATSISQGINTRFDIYEGPFSNWRNASSPYIIGPAVNVRKGIRPDVAVHGPNVDINDCVGQGSSGTPGDDHLNDVTVGWDANATNDYVYGLADNDAMSAPNLGIPGASIGTGDWPIEDYLSQNYGFAAPLVSAIPNSFAGSSSTVGALVPSRYDVYRYEISSGLYTMRHPGEMVGGSPSGESGETMCGPNKTHPIEPITATDRRVTVAAIIDCGTVGDGGGVNEYPVNAFASIFLARPMERTAPSVDSTIDVEIIDITGFGGNGTLDNFIRAEAILVR
ncbi:MAG: hypothetical protein COB16_08705 [Rhodobacteraceae bacterium]|nr:MAG: hypothetical protein COB16_08705 [Paracoccaceae bacterium]